VSVIPYITASFVNVLLPYYWWPLTDDSGSTTAIELIRGNTGFVAAGGSVAFGAPSFSTDPGSAMECEGGYLATTTETGAPLLPTFNITQAIWFRTISSGIQGLMSGADQQQGTAGVHNWDRLMYVGDSGKLNYGVFDEATLIGHSVQSPAVVNDGRWHWSVGSVGPLGTLLALDGEIVDTTDYEGPAQDNYAGWWRVGGAVDAGGLYSWPDGPDFTTNDYPFTGRLAQAMIWDSQLDALQMSAMYTSNPFSPTH
jgi:Concanavalin A-like lectin/glucanases superfamily